MKINSVIFASFLSMLPQFAGAARNHVRRNTAESDFDEWEFPDEWEEVFNGSAASSGEFPAFALLCYDGSTTSCGGCGGVLITTTHVLTAGHCLDLSVTGGLSVTGVRIGAALTQDDGTYFAVSSTAVHPSYTSTSSPFTLNYDVAVLTLSSTVSGVTPLSFNRDSTASSTSGQSLTAIGYGTYDAAGSSISTYLRKTTVASQTDTTCNNYALSQFSATFYDSNLQMCTYTTNTGTCRGDSGGPILTSSSLVLGVLSWGATDCSVDSADFWADTWYFAGWIDEQTGTPGSPTPSPTPAPTFTLSPTAAPICSCFSQQATIPVQNQGPVHMPNLNHGDKVLTANGYHTLYGFGHQDTKTETEFLQIHTKEYPKPLEITAHHLVYVVGKSNAVLANSIRPGDVLRSTQWQDGVTVKKITTTHRKGLFAPMTTDGTLVVDGIVTSCYIALQNQTGEYLEMKGGITLPVSQHFFYHLGLTPARMVCLGISEGLCKSYDEDGLAYFVKVNIAAARWADSLSLPMQIVLTPLYLMGMSVLYGLELLLGPKLALLVILTCVTSAMTAASARAVRGIKASRSQQRKKKKKVE